MSLHIYQVYRLIVSGKASQIIILKMTDDATHNVDTKEDLKTASQVPLKARPTTEISYFGNCFESNFSVKILQKNNYEGKEEYATKNSIILFHPNLVIFKSLSFDSVSEAAQFIIFFSVFLSGQ